MTFHTFRSPMLNMNVPPSEVDVQQDNPQNQTYACLLQLSFDNPNSLSSDLQKKETYADAAKGKENGDGEA
ncbi:hypothetical protein RHMOL_Rhmol01G0204500 [Rhododendron molle]|uniref:Uncharacterized protein n=1 Tax=Rhododendron molle TaxID=49168 RepID=A0ACC0Q435_RHOML|nr:hypothetical protein RHMOL_Rhmol01G0204500 [Rhododendron molle]